MKTPSAKFTLIAALLLTCCLAGIASRAGFRVSQSARHLPGCSASLVLPGSALQ